MGEVDDYPAGLDVETAAVPAASRLTRSRRRGLDRPAGKVDGLGEVSEWPKERDWKSRTW
jgi:hypothetical protein